ARRSATSRTAPSAAARSNWPSTRPRTAAGPSARLAQTTEQPIERGVALVHAFFHARLDHAVAVRGVDEEDGRDEPGATVAEVLELHGVERDVAGHAVELEGERE